MNDIVSRIYELISQSGMSKSSFADKIGISRNTVQNWKKLNSLPTLNVILKICGLFNITVEQFFCGVGRLDGKNQEEKFLDNWRMLNDAEKLAIRNCLAAFKVDKAVEND